MFPVPHSSYPLPAPSSFQSRTHPWCQPLSCQHPQLKSFHLTLLTKPEPCATSIPSPFLLSIVKEKDNHTSLQIGAGVNFRHSALFSPAGSLSHCAQWPLLSTPTPALSQQVISGTTSREKLHHKQTSSKYPQASADLQKDLYLNITSSFSFASGAAQPPVLWTSFPPASSAPWLYPPLACTTFSFNPASFPPMFNNSEVTPTPKNKNKWKTISLGSTSPL